MKDLTLGLLVRQREAATDDIRPISKKCINTVKINRARVSTRRVGQEYVFTLTAAPYGSWRDIGELAENALRPVSVALQESEEKMRLSLSGLARDAFDVILPTAQSQALEFVIYSAVDFEGHRRLTLTRVGHA